MGHVGSAIASRLGYNKKWKLSWVMSGNNYKSYLQKDLLMLRAVKNALNNYGNPDFSFDLRRNNKEEDSNKKSGDEGILKNPFVSKSLTHSHTRIARGLYLTVSTYVMDSHLDGWRIKYTRNFKKIPSILFKPVIRNRRKPRLLLWFKKKRKTVNNVSSRKSKKLRKKKKIFVPPKAIRNKFRLSKKNKKLAKLLKLKNKPGYKIVAKKKKDSFIVGDKKTTGAFFKKILKRFFKVTQNTNPKKNVIKTTFKQKVKLKRYKYKYKRVATREVYYNQITEPVVENTINSRRLNQTYLNYIEKKLLVTKKINLFSVLLFDVVYSAITSLPKRLFNFITGCFKHGVLLYNNVKKKCLVYTMILVVSLVLFNFATEHKVTTSKQKIIIMENTTNMESFATRIPEVKVANDKTFKILVEDNNHLPEHGKNKRFIKLYRRYKSYWDNFCSNSGGVFKKLSRKLSPKNAFSKIITYFNDSVYNIKKKALKKKMKRYPLFFFQWLLKYRYSFLLPPSTNRFTVFKALILGFRWIIRHSKKVHFFFLTIFRSLLLSLFLLPGFIPRFFMIKMLSLLILKEFSYRHLNSYFFNKIFNTRFIVFQTTYAALSSTIQSFDSFTRFSYNFFGMHTRNVTPSLVVNYICHKLGQYFQINQIIGPVIRHLKRLKSLRGFCLKIFGRLTRKERAAVIIRKFRRVTLAKKSADIEHASQSKALRFGMSGVSAWFMLKDEGAKPMAYNFSMSFFPYLTRAQNRLELPRINRKLTYIFVRFPHNNTNKSNINTVFSLAKTVISYTHYTPYLQTGASSHAGVNYAWQYKAFENSRGGRLTNDRSTDLPTRFDSRKSSGITQEEVNKVTKYQENNPNDPVIYLTWGGIKDQLRENPEIFENKDKTSLLEKGPNHGQIVTVPFSFLNFTSNIPTVDDQLKKRFVVLTITNITDQFGEDQLVIARLHMPGNPEYVLNFDPRFGAIDYKKMLNFFCTDDLDLNAKNKAAIWHAVSGYKKLELEVILAQKAAKHYFESITRNPKELRSDFLCRRRTQYNKFLESHPTFTGLVNSPHLTRFRNKTQEYAGNKPDQKPILPSYTGVGALCEMQKKSENDEKV